MDKFRVDISAETYKLMQEICGAERARVIHAAIANVALQNVMQHEMLAMSGALRWPPSMRPECAVMTNVGLV